MKSMRATAVATTSSHAVNATLYRKLDYSLTRDFAVLSNLASVPLLLVVNPSVPARSARELAARAARDSSLNYSSGGTGTAAHLAGAQFATLSGSKITHVPYKGGAQALQDLQVLSNAIAESVATPAVRQKFAAIGAKPIGNRHEQFQPFVEAEVRRRGELVKASGATAD